MSKMFQKCRRLKRVYVGKGWSTEGLKYTTSRGASYDRTTDKLFVNCKSLVGGKGTKYNARRITAAYARADKKGAPGYFTLRS